MATDKPRETQPVSFWYPLYNWLSLFGIAIIMVAVLIVVGLAVVDRFVTGGLPYAGVFYIVAALGGGAGALITAGGALRIRWNRRRGLLPRPPALLTLNLLVFKHRVIAFSALGVGLTALVFFGVSSYAGIHYVESDAFCTGTCHAPMRPEAVAHEHSPHAQIDCVACHVGEGAGSFIQAKLNGLRQLQHVILGDYPRPIPTPIYNLRPARETCEQCHWRHRWVGFKEKLYSYYGSDENNSVNRLRLLVKVGGEQSGLLHGEGIHYHMMLGRKVEFIARDHQRQDVVWVRVVEPDGSIKEFENAARPLTTEERRELPIRRMDCLDCHNRPAHRFRSPMVIMNEMLEGGRIDRTLPFVKLKGVEVLSVSYPDTTTAEQQIAKTLREYYDSEHPGLTNDKLPQAISAIQEAYAHNMFPEMNATWEHYPDNIGHRDSPGCFRCHNDRLVNAEKEPIFTTCTKCHVVLGQREEVAPLTEAFLEGQAFYHRADEETKEDFTDCADCHTGGSDTY